MPSILVVDDDKSLRGLIRRMLEPEGFEVDEAPDGRAALKAFRARTYDLILCDLFMPDGDGLELLRELCEEFLGAKVLAMSGGGFRGTLDMLDTAHHLGAVGVMQKPFQRAELLHAIKLALEA